MDLFERENRSVTERNNVVEREIGLLERNKYVEIETTDKKKLREKYMRKKKSLITKSKERENPHNIGKEDPMVTTIR